MINFSTPSGQIDYVEQLREAASQKPIEITIYQAHHKPLLPTSE
jgi:hypothetical protein